MSLRTWSCLTPLLAWTVAACGTSTTATTTATDDTAVTDNDATSDTGAGGTDATSDTTTADVGKDVAGPSCASRAGAYTVEGQCTGGASSITFACMMANACELSWVSGYRAWTGPLTGTHFELASPSGAETITGDFQSADIGTYTYNGGVTCDATMTRLDPSQADSLCCDVKLQDCKSGDACVVVQEKAGVTTVLTTGCLPLAATPLAEGATCTQSGSESPCAAGLLCVRSATSTGDTGTCIRECIGDTDCTGGTACATVVDAPRAGICRPQCVPFADGACPSDQTCRATSFADATATQYMAGECSPNGKLADGATCTQSIDCGAGEICTTTGCKAQCDSKHPCASGTCTDFGLKLGKGVTAGFGFCK